MDQRPGEERPEDELRELRFERLEFEREYREAVDESERARRGLDEVVLEFLFRGDVIRLGVGGEGMDRERCPCRSRGDDP